MSAAASKVKLDHVCQQRHVVRLSAFICSAVNTTVLQMVPTEFHSSIDIIDQCTLIDITLSLNAFFWEWAKAMDVGLVLGYVRRCRH